MVRFEGECNEYNVHLGLCRTCEILGAEKLIISSLERLTSTEFKTLSVTAENHIPIEEVKSCY